MLSIKPKKCSFKMRWKMRTKKMTKKEKKESRLLRYWNRKKGKLTPKQLITLVIEAEYLPLRKSGVETFLDIKGLVFDDYYKMCDAAQDFFKEDEALSKKFYENFFDICTADHLMELLFEGDTKAANELFRRIDTREIKEDESKQILKVLFEKITDAGSRKLIYKKTEKLGFNDEELDKMSEIANRAFLFDIVDRIKRKIRGIKKRSSKGEEVLEKLRKLLQDLKEEQV